jgi:hypothetical protein
VDFELRSAFVAVFQPLFDQRDREMRDVDPDPFALQLLRRIHCRAATAERIEHYVAFVCAGGDYSFKQL